MILVKKRIIAATLYYGGFVGLIKTSQKESIIVGYHRILPSNSKERDFIQPGMYVTLETFEKHISYLSRNYNIISLKDILKEKKAHRACVVTFDDGWADNYKYAFPVLKRYNIPATIFLATKKVGTSEWPWTDMISFSIHMAGIDKFIHTMINGLVNLGISPPEFVKYLRCREKFTEYVIEYMKNLNPAVLFSLVNYIDSEMAIYTNLMKGSRPWLTWDEVNEMSQHGIDFGAHSHNHVILTNIPLPEVRSELCLSRDILTRIIKKPIRTFCYPNGRYNNAVVSILKESGYDVAVTTKRGSIDGSSSTLCLNRIMIHNDMTSTIPMFACVLTGKIPYF